jgi:hypothetical protein
MSEQLDRTSEQDSLADQSESKSAAHSFAVPPGDPAANHSFSDRRPETLLMRKIQEMANNSTQVQQQAAIQQMANHHAQPIQRDVPMKQPGTDASRTSGSSEEIEAEVDATIARGNELEINVDLNRLRTSFQHRTDHSAEFEEPDGGHEWRIGFEKRMLQKLQAASTVIREAREAAAAAQAEQKEARREAARRRKVAKKAREAAEAEQAAAEVREAREARQEAKKAERREVWEQKQAAQKAQAAAEKEARAAEEALRLQQEQAEAERQAHIQKMAALGIVGAAVLSAAAWGLSLLL